MAEPTISLHGPKTAGLKIMSREDMAKETPWKEYWNNGIVE
jgi:hypothetical protein